MGFLKGKYYNRCARIHELLANSMEQKLCIKFLSTLSSDQVEDMKHFSNLYQMIMKESSNSYQMLTCSVIVLHKSRLQVLEICFSSREKS